MDDSSTDDDSASQTTEDDPQVPEHQAVLHPPAPVAPPPTAVPRERPNYEARHVLRGHTMSISAVKFSPDGKLLASCGAEKVVKIWSPDTGEFLRNLSGHTQGLSDIAWSSDNVHLASASDDTTIRIWDVDSVRHQQLTSIADSQHVQFSPNSKYILSTAHDSAIRLWDYQTTRCLKTYTGHVNSKYCISACFSVTGGKWIVAGSEDNKVYIWDLQTRQIVQVLGGHSGELNPRVQVWKRRRMNDKNCTRCGRRCCCESLASGEKKNSNESLAYQTHPLQNMIATGSIDSDLSIRIWSDRGPKPVG
ncbi:hypothetical protein J132_03401 [Termitomyces sp. J132]|nr:hypothetical protein J132_03401 [Termitomyces sp. J132]